MTGITMSMPILSAQLPVINFNTDCDYNQPEITMPTLHMPLIPQTSSASLLSSKHPLICNVCGDNATGIHYRTVSCNGCKTFFRRAVVSHRKFVCKNGGNCVMDKGGRCGCRACRFQKCVDAGMDVNAIQHSPSVNLTLSIARKRVFRQQQRASDSGSADEFSTSSSERGTKSPRSPSILGEHDELFKTINTVLRIDEKHTRLRLSSWNPYVEQHGLLEFLSCESAYGTATRYPLVTAWPNRPKGYLDKRSLKSRGIKFWYFCDIATSVEHLKTFEFFPQLYMSDKIAWARHVCIAGTILFTSYYAYTKQSQVVVFPDGGIPFGFKPENKLIPIERIIRHSVVDKMYDLKMDRIQFALVRNLVALTDAPTDASSILRDKLSTERSRHATCLLRYLQSRHGTQNGLHFFVDTINLISLLFRRVEVNKAYYAYRSCISDDIGASRLMAQLLMDQQEKHDIVSNIFDPSEIVIPY